MDCRSPPPDVVTRSSIFHSVPNEVVLLLPLDFGSQHLDATLSVSFVPQEIHGGHEWQQRLLEAHAISQYRYQTAANSRPTIGFAKSTTHRSFLRRIEKLKISTKYID